MFILAAVFAASSHGVNCHTGGYPGSFSVWQVLIAIVGVTSVPLIIAACSSRLAVFSASKTNHDRQCTVAYGQRLDTVKIHGESFRKPRSGNRKRDSIFFIVRCFTLVCVLFCGAYILLSRLMIASQQRIVFEFV